VQPVAWASGCDVADATAEDCGRGALVEAEVGLACAVACVPVWPQDANATAASNPVTANKRKRFILFKLHPDELAGPADKLRCDVGDRLLARMAKPGSRKKAGRI